MNRSSNFQQKWWQKIQRKVVFRCIGWFTLSLRYNYPAYKPLYFITIWRRNPHPQPWSNQWGRGCNTLFFFPRSLQNSDLVYLTNLLSILRGRFDLKRLGHHFAGGTVGHQRQRVRWIVDVKARNVTFLRKTEKKYGPEFCS